MKFILEFIAVITVSVLPNVLAAFLNLRDSTFEKKGEQFSISAILLSTWLNAIAVISVVLLVAYQQPNGFASIGIRLGQSRNNFGAIFIGYFGVCLFIIFFAIGQRLILHRLKQPTPPTIDTSNPSTVASLRYQDFWERLANLTVLPFSAISEDLVYRGYLILLLGQLTNTFLPWAVISIGLMVLIHLYQGRTFRLIIFHFLLASFLTGLTLATQNILAPITAHIFLNFVNRVKLWMAANKPAESNSVTANNNGRRFAYVLFTIINVFILVLATIVVFA